MGALLRRPGRALALARLAIPLLELLRIAAAKFFALGTTSFARRLFGALRIASAAFRCARRQFARTRPLGAVARHFVRRADDGGLSPGKS
ncbi:hypothetical protein ARD30_20050 [Bosea thiooxidans]|uniref:Uncharacterized protein n=1 Tax=Bosea thiooxidans TaxID=53254 RepID=A0A0Q3KXR2_9HYPH|nr:hypothetical protein ARD30_20050 [Bosea thiooxidans]